MKERSLRPGPAQNQPETQANGAPLKEGEYRKVCQFKVVHFYDQELKREVIILYALTIDGIIREFTNGVWKPFPIPAT